jgi:dethiobiotin synthetase
VTAVFVTSSGTGIGKTLVAAALVHQVRRQGRDARALKPIMTGFDAADAADSDAGVILRSLGQAVTEPAVRNISPWRFRASLSPDMAAAREGARIPFDDLVGFCRHAVADADRGGATLVVEGIGGVMVPLDERSTVRDWIAELELPAIVVVGTYLGSLSHALTALDALRTRGCPIAGLVVSESAEGAAPLAEVVSTLARHAGGLPIAAVPRLALQPEPWRAVPDLLPLLRQIVSKP